ncbi:hypothetical protein HYFRA_00013083 [Hymenoscyphus fraxineus]|uniref:BTB domain-containing protein n=1 Tax=Hymenoscyphus fraxineus TaxID=746836 RepID=A0A9N9L758_9HELO|nr:hypothetical protein HYFRA_00013083 [Hymenoscyphus fraxineus]
MARAKKPKVTPSKRVNPIAVPTKGPKSPRPENVFKGPQGEAPDMRIELLGTEFHVYSPVLKLYSAFFAKFLEPGNKPPKPDVPFGSKQLKYDWVTQVDDDGQSYCLTDLTNYTPVSPDWQLILYGLELADYYLALPEVSRSINYIPLTDPWSYFKMSIAQDCVSILPLAMKLKHKLLFKECCIFLCNPYSDPRLNQLEDPKLKAIVKTAYNKVTSDLVQVFLTVIDAISKNTSVKSPNRITLNTLEEAIRTAQRGEDQKLLPASLFRKLKILNSEKDSNSWSPRCALFDSVFPNHSALRPDLVADGDNFYCGLIDDDLIPWDTDKDGV